VIFVTTDASERSKEKQKEIFIYLFDLMYLFSLNWVRCIRHSPAGIGGSGKKSLLRLLNTYLFPGLGPILVGPGLGRPSQWSLPLSVTEASRRYSPAARQPSCADEID
jgi:hypothetical protein